jgi:hypothetical protein
VRVVDAGLVLWSILWLAAGAYVYTSVQQLEDYGDTVVTASVGLQQASDGLVRAGTGLRETGDALGRVPFVGGSLDAPVRRTADDVDRIAVTLRRTARQARVSGEQTREGATEAAVILGLAVAVVPIVPFAVLYLLLRPLIAQRLAAG